MQAILLLFLSVTSFGATRIPLCEFDLLLALHEQNPVDRRLLDVEQIFTAIEKHVKEAVGIPADPRMAKFPAQVRFLELIDEEIRKQPGLATAVFQLALNRLPYLKETQFNVILSGGVVAPWQNVLQTAAAARGYKINIVPIPGMLAARGSRARPALPFFPPEDAAALAEHPTIFLDDTYSSGETAAVVREAVEREGGRVHGVFVALEGGRGDPASLSKSRRGSASAPSFGNFSERPIGWEWARGRPEIAIALDGGLFAEGAATLSLQGERFLAALNVIAVTVTFLQNGNKVTPPRTIVTSFPNLNFAAIDAPLPILSIGPVGNAAIPFHVSTERIFSESKKRRYTEDLLDVDYFLNRLSDLGTLKPVFSKRVLSPLVVRPVSVPISRVRRPAPELIIKAEPDELDFDDADPHSKLTAILETKNPVKRTELISKISWPSLNAEEQTRLIAYAGVVINTYEIGALIKHAASSGDARWRSVLDQWLSDWNDPKQKWQIHLRKQAEAARSSYAADGIHP